MGEDSDDDSGRRRPALQSTEAMMRLMMCVGGEEGKTYDEVVSHHYRPCELTPAASRRGGAALRRFGGDAVAGGRTAYGAGCRDLGNALAWAPLDVDCDGVSLGRGSAAVAFRWSDGQPFGCAIHGGGDGILVLEDCFRAGAETLRGGKLARAPWARGRTSTCGRSAAGGSSTHALLVHGRARGLGLVALRRGPGVRRPPAWRDDDGSSNGPWVFGVGYGAALAGPPVAVSQRVPTRGTAFALWRCSLLEAARRDNGLDLYLAGDGGVAAVSLDLSDGGGRPAPAIARARSLVDAPPAPEAGDERHAAALRGLLPRARAERLAWKREPEGDGAGVAQDAAAAIARSLLG
ncbi:FAD dependent oxidoreductase [Aureococcus anophagefferens]|nr:FAD dependent oxidoreductase [Aureococcus anophagefferens]